MSDWARIRSETNRMRAGLFDPLSEAATNITAMLAQGIRLRREDAAAAAAEARAKREEERQAQREREAGAYAELAQLSASGSIDREALVGWLEKNKGRVGTTAAAGVLHISKELRDRKEKAMGAAAAAGMPYDPAVPADAYPVLAKKRAEEEEIQTLAPVLEAVRAGKSVDPALRARFQNQIGKEEDNLRAAAKQKAEEVEKLEDEAALVQMYEDPEKLTAKQKARVARIFQAERRIERQEATEEMIRGEVAAVDAAGEEDLPGVRVTTPQGLTAKDRKRGYFKSVAEAKAAANRAEKSGARADLQAALSATSTAGRNAEAALDEIAPTDPFTKTRVIQPGKEERARDLQATIDAMAAQAAELQKKGAAKAGKDPADEALKAALLKALGK